ncbi:MAG: hypothetical protein DRG11_02735 [Epsilonproteobacteria bacterium]|nr:MAG: hypothetical protein DRG11_02735 [Campylobacterota bacterium]
MRYIFVIFFFILVFSGCVQKQYFQPDDTVGYVPSEDIVEDSYILNYISGRLILLENDKLITKDKELATKLQKNQEIVNYEHDEVFISYNNDLILSDTNRTIKLESKVISLAKKGNILALVLQDNSMILYDLELDEVVFKEKHDHSYINNKKVATPIFINKTVLFPTLDGKVSVVSLSQRKTLRNLIVATTGLVKNVSYLNVVNNTLIAATNNNILTFGNTKLNLKEYEVANIVADGGFIYIATVDGQIIKLNHKLEEINKKKYKFAKILTLAVTNKFIYGLESQNYLIKLSKNFKTSQIYDIWFNEYEKTTYLKDKLYYDNRYLKLR